jgi:hypothetical protein
VNRRYQHEVAPIDLNRSRYKKQGAAALTEHLHLGVVGTGATMHIAEIINWS